MCLKICKLGLLFFALIQLHAGHAHGDLSERIEQKTLEIKANSTNNLLYFERGILYHQHEEYKKAISDYITSKDLGNTSSMVEFRLANSYLELNKLDLGLTAVNTYLEANPNDVKGFKLKGHILAEKDQFEEAKPCFEYIMKNMVDIRPEDYVFYSDLTAFQTKDYNAALDIIENGLEKLGHNSASLQLKKLDYLVASNKTNAALKQYDYFINSVNRKEFWYYKKAKFLAKINDTKNSILELEQSKLAIDKLPNRFKNLKAIKELINNITQLEKTLNHEN